MGRRLWPPHFFTPTRPRYQTCALRRFPKGPAVMKDGTAAAGSPRIRVIVRDSCQVTTKTTQTTHAIISVAI